MNFNSFGLSDIGLSRQNNEDVWVAIPEIGFFALADGMGGHQAGEVAAQQAIDHLSFSIQKIKSRNQVKQTVLSNSDFSKSNQCESYAEEVLQWDVELRHAIEKANQWVYKLGQKTDSLNGMGTTLCCLIWSETEVVYAHVGDSRIYRLRNNKLELLTQDHSLFAKWLKTGKDSETPFPYKNVITRAVGTALKANPEIVISSYEPQDLFLLCTDGLTDVLSLEDIEATLTSNPSLEIATINLIEKAKMKGSSDNITILVIQKSIDNEKCEN